MTSKFKSPEDFHQRLGMVFHAALGIPLLPFVILFLEIKNNNYTGQIAPGVLASIISYIVPLLAGLLTLFGYNKMKFASNAAQRFSTLHDKLSHFYKGISVFYWLVGLACTIMSVALWLTGYGVLIVAYVIVLFAMSLNRPTTKRYVAELKLKGEERDIILNNKDYSFE